MKYVNNIKIVKTETDEKLYKMLKDIWDNEHFYLGVIIILKTEENKLRMLEALESNLEYFEFEEDYTEYTDKIIRLAHAFNDGEV